MCDFVLYVRYKIAELLCYITMGVVPALVLLSMVSEAIYTNISNKIGHSCQKC